MTEALTSLEPKHFVRKPILVPQYFELRVDLLVVRVVLKMLIL